MVYDVLVFCRSARLPTAHRLEESLAASGVTAGFSAGFDLATASNSVVPVVVNGVKTLVQVRANEISQSYIDLHEAEMRSSGGADTTRVELLKSNDTKITISVNAGSDPGVARLVALAVLRLAGGGLVDPQTNDVVR